VLADLQEPKTSLPSESDMLLTAVARIDACMPPNNPSESDSGAPSTVVSMPLSDMIGYRGV
jgi:hypothetical protein